MNSSTIQTPTIMNLDYIKYSYYTNSFLKDYIKLRCGSVPVCFNSKIKLVLVCMYIDANSEMRQQLLFVKDTILVLARCLEQYEERKEQRFGNMDATIRDIRAICEACAIHQEALGIPNGL